MINKNRNPVETLKKHGIILYMGTDSQIKIIDAACGLATWKPFEMIYYAGEQRDDLNTLITNTFNPIIEAIINFRIEKKRANIYPCLTLLCLVYNQSTGAVCEFRSHYTAESGSQLIIPGFISKKPPAGRMRMPMDILGKPQNIPTIKGFC
ncbi:MAG: hypothetical protein EA365_10485 [Gloeocapsa sp. DLM2.Bin57]|nr:MAG: hypothetical protein EA365_10485 [Gloeocapsa sp. DLM2.Bin57]